MGLSTLYFCYPQEIKLQNKPALFSRFYLDTHNDSIDGGSSISKIDTSVNFNFFYQLGDKIRYPYCTFEFRPLQQFFVDLSSYNEVQVKIKSKEGVRVPLILLTNLEGYSSTEKRNSFLHNEYFMQTSKDWSIIKVPIKEMEIASWWYKMNHKTEKDPLIADFSKVYSIEIGSCGNLDSGVSDQIEIEYITFTKNKSLYYASLVIILFGLLITVYSLRNPPPKPEYKPLKSENEKEEIISSEEVKDVSEEILESIESLSEEEASVLEYLQNNFNKCDLSLSEMQMDLGLNERKITAIVKEYTNSSFKQHLNNLRMDEARRLLRKTDLNVSEIAYQIGYSNVSHFNRVFKSYEDVSPSDYRTNHSLKYP